VLDFEAFVYLPNLQKNIFTILCVDIYELHVLKSYYNEDTLKNADAQLYIAAYLYKLPTNISWINIVCN